MQLQGPKDTPEVCVNLGQRLPTRKRRTRETHAHTRKQTDGDKEKTEKSAEKYEPLAPEVPGK